MPLIRKPADSAAADNGGSDLTSPSPEARWAAARALANPQSVGRLASALAQESEPRVREAILTSLARVATPEAAQAVAPYIRSEDAQVRTAALDALRAMPGAAIAALPGLLADSDADVRLLACEVVRGLSGPDATRLLVDLLETEAEANVCAAAIDVLAEVGGPEALPTLIRCEARFADQPFLAFSVRVAAERIGAKPAGPLA